jgi:hypothetical protein
MIHRSPRVAAICQFRWVCGRGGPELARPSESSPFHDCFCCGVRKGRCPGPSTFLAITLAVIVPISTMLITIALVVTPIPILGLVVAAQPIEVPVWPLVLL